jgi:putative ABC transport system permease protein
MGLLRIARGELTSRFGRNLLTVLALALGVALIVAVSLLGRSTTRAFAVMADALGARIDLEVSAGEAGFPEEMLATVQAAEGVASAAPIVLGTVFLGGEDGDSLAVMGIDTLADRGVHGELVHASPEMPVADPLATLNSPEAVVVTEELVHRLRLARDQRLEVETPSGRKSLTVRGAVRTEGFLRVYGDSLAFMDILAAQQLFGKDRRYDRISIDVKEGVSPEQVAAELRARLPRGLTVQPPQQRRADMDAMLGAFRYALSAVSLLSLLVGLCMVFNTMSTAVARRQGELGILRAVGGRRRDLSLLILLEAGLYGVLAAVLGSVLGVWLAGLMTAPVAASVESQMAISLGRPTPAPPELTDFLKAFAGVIAAIAGAYGPARRAGRVAVVQSLRADAIGAASSAPIGRLGRWGLGLLAAGAALIVAGRLGAGTSLLTIGLLPSLAAAILLAAAGCVIAARSSRRALGALFGIRGVLVATSAARVPARIAFTAAILAIGIMLHVTVAAIHQSVRASVLADVADDFAADLMVSSVFSSGGRLSDPVEAAMAERLSSLPGVADVVALRGVAHGYGDAQIWIDARSPQYFADSRFGTKEYVAGEPHAARAAVGGGEAVLVSHNFAHRYDVSVGDELTLETPSGRLTVPIRGVVVDHFSPAGTVLMSLDLYRRWWRDPLANEFAVLLDRGADPAAVERLIKQEFGESYRLRILENREFLDHVRAQVDRAFAFAPALEAVIFLVVALSLADTLLVGILERTREIGVLRALGATRRDMVWMVGLEALLVSALGAAFGVVQGVVLSAVWMRIYMVDLFGIMMPLVLPWSVVGGAAAMAVIVALLAAIYPVRRASRMSVARALAYE